MANKFNVKRIELSIRQGRKLMLKYRNEQKQEVAEEFDLPVIIQFAQCHELWMPLSLISMEPYRCLVLCEEWDKESFMQL